ncbi:MAG: NAD(P)H-hydrate epimerase [Rubripirellula sp.]|jgi:NAD(P)H-hydrate epimerase
MTNLPALTRAQVRSVDQTAIEEYGIPGIVLMENAGSRAAEIIHRVVPEGPIEVLCGSGNNAGDGYVIARHLQLMGREIDMICAVPVAKLSGDAHINAMIAARSEIPMRIIDPEAYEANIPDLDQKAAAVVDALLGTGARGPLRGCYRDLVQMANVHSGMRIAIDIPTGLDCDTGEASHPTLLADHTITFVAEKVGFKKNNADDYVGVVHVVGIGVPEKLLNALQSGTETSPCGDQGRRP